MRISVDARRKGIVETARPLFFAQGYGSMTMDKVAAAVGGSKATLYRYFPSKEELFAAVILSAGNELLAEMESLQFETCDLSVALHRLACAYLRLLLSPGVLEVNRLVISEANRFPQLGRLFYKIGPERTTNKLKAALAAIGAHHQVPALGDPTNAMFFKSLCEGDLLVRRLLGVIDDVDEQQIDAAASSAVSEFLAHVGTS